MIITNEMLMKLLNRERELEVERLSPGRRGDHIRIAQGKDPFRWRIVRKALMAVANSINHKSDLWRQTI